MTSKKLRESIHRIKALVDGTPILYTRRCPPSQLQQSFQGDPVDTASKGGLEALMRALAVELGPRGIAANAIAPGFLTERKVPPFSQPRIVEMTRRIL